MTNRPPNILFIVADDLNSWIGALDGHPQTRTPNIDRLAAQGFLFERAYCAAPYCNASRMSVFLGFQPSTSGIYQNELVEGQTYFEALRTQSYRTAAAGKVFHGHYDYAEAGHKQLSEAAWMTMHPQNTDWDDILPIVPEPMPRARPLNRMFDFSRFQEVSPWNHLFDWGVLPEARETEMPDAHVVRAASAFLARSHDAPFLFAAGFYKPHLPWYAPQRFFDLHPLEDIILPDVRADELDDVPPIPRQWALDPPDHETVLRYNQWSRAVQGYLAAISYCDFQIGQVLDALEASPAADDTIIVLWGGQRIPFGRKTALAEIRPLGRGDEGAFDHRAAAPLEGHSEAHRWPCKSGRPISHAFRHGGPQSPRRTGWPVPDAASEWQRSGLASAYDMAQRQSLASLRTVPLHAVFRRHRRVLRSYR
jgi:arylsulfatase A-like enzyme